jgi:LysM repeat protein
MTISANTRTRVVVLLTSVALALALLLAVAVAARAEGPAVATPDDITYVTHTVRVGDTLWDIAMAHAPEGSDVRNFVFDLKTVNGLETSNIQPGQVLHIPVP